jgi:hypothetical protein
MKKNAKPLTLHFESLRVLELHLPNIVVGTQSGAPSCAPTCGIQGAGAALRTGNACCV